MRTKLLGRRRQGRKAEIQLAVEVSEALSVIPANARRPCSVKGTPEKKRASQAEAR